MLIPFQNRNRVVGSQKNIYYGLMWGNHLLYPLVICFSICEASKRALILWP